MNLLSIRNVCYLFLIGSLFSCKKPSDEIDMGYDYFPISIGKYVEYEITQITIDKVANYYDTSRYFLKEKLESQFVDNQGRPSIRIERYWRNADSLPWVIKDVWYSTRTSAIAEKVEENVRFIKMAFPITETKVWDGNAFNVNSTWNYDYSDIAISYSLNGLSFSDCIKINQRNNINFVEYEKAWEVYAKGIGLIHKEFIDVDVINGDTSNVRVGVKFYQKVRSYGVE